MAKLCVRAFVTGRVQGVWFRKSTKEEAAKLGLTGYAINLQDGRVEVMLCGESDALSQLQVWLSDGPKLARVDQVVFEELDYRAMEGFMIG